jgi:cbb3-type cytochrome oxidase maturation protein
MAWPSVLESCQSSPPKQTLTGFVSYSRALFFRLVLFPKQRRIRSVNILVFLIPLALLMGLAGLVAFIWALKSGQFDDPDGAASRILFEDDDAPSP